MLGMLVTALFLSFGAPFWFNALRDMSNLRPILAGKVEKDKDIKDIKENKESKESKE